ncbi:MAG: hypothetical protein U0694_01830 [Anaerolineae bacterium]
MGKPERAIQLCAAIINQPKLYVSKRPSGAADERHFAPELPAAVYGKQRQQRVSLPDLMAVVKELLAE